MKIGTKSVLFGVHCFLLHPVFVAIAWVKLYGFPLDPRIWIAFFVHDLGYIGKPNMDGIEGEKHVEFGAKLMHIFDGYTNITATFDNDSNEFISARLDELKEDGYHIVDYLELDTIVSVMLRKRSTYWHDFTMYHSRYYAKKFNFNPSKLCYADKLAFCIPPMWLYLILGNLSGEIKEYIHMGCGHRNYDLESQISWYKQVKKYLTEYVNTCSIEGVADNITTDNRKIF
jgi:hypothetical protein